MTKALSEPTYSLIIKEVNNTQTVVYKSNSYLHAFKGPREEIKEMRQY